MTGKTIVILGGGTGGVVASNDLRRKLGEQHRVILVDKERSAPVQPIPSLGHGRVAPSAAGNQRPAAHGAAGG
jgi:sulfide:quinone oxidoreductase